MQTLNIRGNIAAIALLILGAASVIGVALAIDANNDTLKLTSSTEVVATVGDKLTNNPEPTKMPGTVKYRNLTVPLEQVVVFDKEVNDQTVAATLTELTLILENEGQAFVFIDSPGGSVFAGIKLTEFISQSKKPIYTVCTGMCASMGAHIFNSGKLRFITSTGVVMHHPISGGVRGTLSEMTTMLKYINKLSVRMDMDVVNRSKLTYEQFELMTLKNVWADTEDSLRYGFADHAVVLEVK